MEETWKDELINELLNLSNDEVTEESLAIQLNN